LTSSSVYFKFLQEEDLPDFQKMSLVTSQPVEVGQLEEGLSMLRTSPSKLSMLMQQVGKLYWN